MCLSSTPAARKAYDEWVKCIKKLLEEKDELKRQLAEKRSGEVRELRKEMKRQEQMMQMMQQQMMQMVLQRLERLEEENRQLRAAQQTRT